MHPHLVLHGEAARRLLLDLGVESRLPATNERACGFLLRNSFGDEMLFERSGAPFELNQVPTVEEAFDMPLCCTTPGCSSARSM